LLVAEKKSYSYEAYIPQYQEEISLPINKPKAKPVKKPRNRAMPILGILIGFAVCAIILQRYAVISMNHSEILQIKKDLAAEQKKTESLMLELSMTDNLENIKEVAEKKLHMGYPQPNQIKYVEIPSDSNEEQDTQLAEAEKEEDKGILNTLYSLLD